MSPARNSKVLRYGTGYERNSLVGGSNPVDGRAELNGVLREFYSVLARNRRGFDLVERSAHEVPEMAQMSFVESRRKGMDGFERYLTHRIESGHFLPVPHVPTAARYIIETVSWFARHRHNTPDSQMPTDHDALETRFISASTR